MVDVCLTPLHDTSQSVHPRYTVATTPADDGADAEPADIFET